MDGRDGALAEEINERDDIKQSLFIFALQKNYHDKTLSSFPGRHPAVGQRL